MKPNTFVEIISRWGDAVRKSQTVFYNDKHTGYTDFDRAKHLLIDNDEQIISYSISKFDNIQFVTDITEDFHSDGSCSFTWTITLVGIIPDGSSGRKVFHRCAVDTCYTLDQAFMQIKDHMNYLDKKMEEDKYFQLMS